MKLLLFDILTQNVLIHPFISLRRTCQKKQGLAPQFKGLSSELMVKALLAGTETAISNYTAWPREFSKTHFINNSIKYLALKALTVTLNTPFLCSSTLETVQSAIVVKDRPAFMECLREGFFRILHLRYMPSTRLLPIWILIGPTILYHVSHVIVVAFVKKSISLAREFMIRKECYNDSIERASYVDDSSSMLNDETIDVTKILDTAEIDSDCQEIMAAFTGTLIADIVLFPFETIMHCLYLQGSRVIIDNCDETTVVLPVITNYDGFVDCCQSIVKKEGILGLYKGLGGVFLQFAMHYLIIRLTHYLIREFTNRKSSRRLCSDMSDDLYSAALPTKNIADDDYYRNPDTKTFKNKITYRRFDDPSQNRSLP